MRLYNPLWCFKYNDEDAAKAFSVLEFHLSFIKLVTFFQACRHLHLSTDLIFQSSDTKLPFSSQWKICDKYFSLSSPSSQGLSYLSWFCLLFLAIGLICQIASGFFLYLVGYVKRNVTMCWIWILIALSNILLAFLFWMSQLYETEFAELPYYFCWELFYNSFGVAFMFNFTKLARENGVAVQVSLSRTESTTIIEGVDDEMSSQYQYHQMNEQGQGQGRLQEVSQKDYEKIVNKNEE